MDINRTIPMKKNLPEIVKRKSLSPDQPSVGARRGENFKTRSTNLAIMLFIIN